MAINEALLGPQEGEEEDFAIEDLVFSTQIALQKAMARKGVSNKDLAERLGMTPARVSQIFAKKGPNLRLSTIARIAHALGEDFEFVRKEENRQPLPKEKAKVFQSVILHINPRLVPSVWQERPANTGGYRKRDLAA